MVTVGKALRVVINGIECISECSCVSNISGFLAIEIRKATLANGV